MKCQTQCVGPPAVWDDRPNQGSIIGTSGTRVSADKYRLSANVNITSAAVDIGDVHVKTMGTCMPWHRIKHTHTHTVAPYSNHCNNWMRHRNQALLTYAQFNCQIPPHHTPGSSMRSKPPRRQRAARRRDDDAMYDVLCLVPLSACGGVKESGGVGASCVCAGMCFGYFCERSNNRHASAIGNCPD